MNKTIMLWGVFLGALAVILGAFGAHGLEGRIAPASLEAYKTGVAYQLAHALLLIILGGLPNLSGGDKKWPFLFLLSGIICFSFSLYFIALAKWWGINTGAIGWVTPLGGLLLIGGWIALAYRIMKPRS